MKRKKKDDGLTRVISMSFDVPMKRGRRDVRCYFNRDKQEWQYYDCGVTELCEEDALTIAALLEKLNEEPIWQK